MKRYGQPPSSTPRFGGGGNGNGGEIVVGAIILLIGALALSQGGGDEGGFSFSDLQQNMVQNRLEDFDFAAKSQRALSKAAESAQIAEDIVAEGTCVKVLNTGDNVKGVEEGRYHVSLSQGMRVLDPLTGGWLPEGVCVQDHLGSASILGPGGIAEDIYFSPNLAENSFTQETTRTTGDAANGAD